MTKLLIMFLFSVVSASFGSREVSVASRHKIDKAIKRSVIKRKAEIRENIIKYFGQSIPLSAKNRITAPIYVTGDAFRAMSNHVFDETDTSFDANNVGPADTVFVSGDFLELFFKYVHNSIKNPYVLITHNSDIAFPGIFQNYLDDSKIMAWFTVNAGICHPKLHAVPIGFQNHHWNIKRNEDIARVLAQKDFLRQHLLLMNFRAGTNIDERGFVFELFSKVNYCYYPGTDRSFYDYLNDLHHAKYCLSPFGNGKDCHRVYEALVMGCVPIVKNSELDQLYEELPVLIINNWQQINQEFLNSKYESITKKMANKEFLTIDFWRNKIRSVGGNTKTV